MANKTSIEWSDATWTPIRARVKDEAGAIAEAMGYTSLVKIAKSMAGHVGPHCEHASPGCERCYSETNNARCLPNNGTGLPFDRRSRDLVDIFLDEHILHQPLHWKEPKKIFVCSQTDLFGEFVPDDFIEQVFAVMALCPQHTFQILTKQAERMRAWMVNTWTDAYVEGQTQKLYSTLNPEENEDAISLWLAVHLPLKNVWIGVSTEDQEQADKRIPLLLQTPAAIRFVSYEPGLGPVDFSPYLKIPQGEKLFERPRQAWNILLDQIIVGGESGPRARRFDVQWAIDTVRQCKEAGVACFVKQLGSNPVGFMGPRPQDRKGGDWSEWNDELRVREFPEVRI